MDIEYDANFEAEILQKFMGIVKVNANDETVVSNIGSKELSCATSSTSTSSSSSSSNSSSNSSSTAIISSYNKEANTIPRIVLDDNDQDITDGDSNIGEATESIAVSKGYEMPELELNTITMVSSINKRFNLDVISKYIKLSEQFIGMLSQGILTASSQKPMNSSTTLKPATDLSTQTATRTTQTATKTARTPTRTTKTDTKEDTKEDTKDDIEPSEGDENLGMEEKKGGNFNNQITFYHYDSDTNEILNLKLFNNGMIVLVGCKETEHHPHKAIKDLLPILECQGIITIPLQTNIKKYFTKDQTNWTKTVSKMIPVYNSLSKAINYYLGWDDIPDKKLPIDLHSLRQVTCEKKRKSIGSIPLTVEQEKKLLILFTVYKIISIYYADTSLMIHDLLDQLMKGKMGKMVVNNFMELFKKICDGFTGTEFTLELSSYMNKADEVISLASGKDRKLDELVYEPNELRIALINMGLKLGFHLDRAEMADILSTRYNQTTRFDPEIYQGIQVSYNSTKDCILHNLDSACQTPTNFITPKQLLVAAEAREYREQKKKQAEKQKPTITLKPIGIQNNNTLTSSDPSSHVLTCSCSCKVVSILVFREGDVIITGSQSWKQTMDAYNFLSDFIKLERQNVQTHFDLIPGKKKTAMGARNMAIKHEDCIYLNKSHLLSNPRNFLLIKKLGLLKEFSS